eukprot:GHVO01051296.1.p2 GENE.GHVO01051296.1~~GHVO01051296.1.p2  ORF type:complete len:273 (-),score=59.52 GHVO01051296.1:328-1146(-)
MEQDFETASLEALRAKLEEYETSLRQIDEAIENEAEPQLHRLKNDLEVVVNLIKDLIKFREAEELEVALPAAPTPPRQEVQLERPRPPRHSHAEAPAPTPVPSTPSGVSVQTVGSALVGRSCLAAHEGDKFVAEILAFKKDPRTGSNKVTVQFVGFTTPEEVPLSSIEILQPVSPALLTPGTRAQAVFSDDGKWYECDIEEQTSNGYRVRYVSYGNTEEVKFDRVRLVGDVVGGVKKRKVKEVVTAGGLRIPETLQIKTGDTEKQKVVKNEN